MISDVYVELKMAPSEMVSIGSEMAVPSTRAFMKDNNVTNKVIISLPLDF